MILGKEINPESGDKLHEALSSYAGSASAIIDPTRVKQGSWKPRAIVYQGFLADLECDRLILIAKSELKGSAVANNFSGESKLSEVRATSGMFFSKNKVTTITILEISRNTLLNLSWIPEWSLRRSPVNTHPRLLVFYLQILTINVPPFYNTLRIQLRLLRKLQTIHGSCSSTDLPVNYTKPMSSLNQEYFIITAAIYQKWREELSEISEIGADGNRNVFQCSITNTTLGRGKLSTDLSIIRKAYGIKKHVTIRFHFVHASMLIFSIPGSRKTKGRINKLVNGNSTGTIKIRQEPPSNLFVSNVPIWGVDIPLWESRISKSLANGGQPLLVPTFVVNTRLTARPPHLPVLLPGGAFQTWNLIWNDKRPSQCHIGHGWYNFGKTHSIKIGDNIQFWARDHGITRITRVTKKQWLKFVECCLYVVCLMTLSYFTICNN
ncbi:putative prolyl 4-hydroxylase [Trifolium repens]|nr:putative prolyl 4-hydroxylase [Trifolium repens]